MLKTKRFKRPKSPLCTRRRIGGDVPRNLLEDLGLPESMSRILHKTRH